MKTPVGAAERRLRARAKARDRKAAERRAKVIRVEAEAEALAPKAQRVAVGLFRGPRVVISPGGRPELASVVRNLAQRQSRRAISGGEPAITELHVAAAERLLAAWREVGDGIGLARELGGRAGGGMGGGPGEAKMQALLRQIRLRREVMGALTALGPLRDVVETVVLAGVDLTAWAEGTGMDRTVAVGFLAAALDMLAAWYEAIDARSQTGRGFSPSGLRGVERAGVAA